MPLVGVVSSVASAVGFLEQRLCTWGRRTLETLGYASWVGGAEARERRAVWAFLVIHPKEYYWEYGLVYIIDVLKALFESEKVY